MRGNADMSTESMADILLSSHSVPKIVDFGLAKMLLDPDVGRLVGHSLCRD